MGLCKKYAYGEAPSLFALNWPWVEVTLVAMEEAMALAMGATGVRRLLQDHTAAVDMVTARDLQTAVAVVVVVVVVVALFDFPTDVGNTNFEMFSFTKLK